VGVAEQALAPRSPSRCRSGRVHELRQPIVFVVMTIIACAKRCQPIASIVLEVAVFGFRAEFWNMKARFARCLVLDLELPAHRTRTSEGVGGQNSPPIIFITGPRRHPLLRPRMKAGAIEFFAETLWRAGTAPGHRRRDRS